MDDGLAAVAAMHDLNMASTYCDRIYIMGEGRVVASGTPAEVLQPCLIRKVFGVGVNIDYNQHSGKPHLEFFLGEAKADRATLNGSKTPVDDPDVSAPQI